MPLKNTAFFALILLLGQGGVEGSDDGSCRLSTEFPAPEVVPWDTRSIKVSWDKVFVNCLRGEVKGLKIIVETTMNVYFEHSVYDVKFEDDEEIVPRPPCSEHSFQLVLEFNEKETRPLTSSKTEYNKPLGTSYKSKDLYSGWLETEVVQNICLKKETDKPTVTIPDPPEALKECIKTKGDEVLELTTVNVGDDVGVKILVQKPWGQAGDYTVSPVVKNIQECTVCQVNTTVPLTAEAHNSSHLRVSWENVFQGCEDFEVKNMVIDIDGEKRNRELDQKTTLIQGSACANHNIFVELILRKSDQTSLKSAEITYAAKESTYCEEAAANNGLAIGLSVGIGSLFIILAAVGMIVFRNQKKTAFEKEDVNEDYGDYYYSDGDRRLDVMEATDGNPDYEGIYTESNMESRAIDNNPLYGDL